MPETFQWLGVVQDALEDYYAETYRDTTKKFLAKNIPGKLLKEGILTPDMSRDTAINQALSYASLREKFAKDGASDPGDLASQAMLKKDKDTMSDIEQVDKEPNAPYFPHPSEMPDFPIVSFADIDMPLESGEIAVIAWTVRGYTAEDVLAQWGDVYRLGGRIRRTSNPGANEHFDNVPPKRGKNELDDYFGSDAPPKLQGNATPKNQAQNQQTGNEVFQSQIAQIELVATKDGKKTGYRVYRNHEYQGKHELKPIGFGDFRLQALEPVIKATGLSFANLPIGTKLPVNVQGLMAEYILEPQPDGKKFSKVVNYVLPNGERTVKAKSSNANQEGDHPF